MNRDLQVKMSMLAPIVQVNVEWAAKNSFLSKKKLFFLVKFYLRFEPKVKIASVRL